MEPAVVEEPSSISQLSESSIRTDRTIPIGLLIFPFASLIVWLLYGISSSTSLLGNLSNSVFWTGLMIILGLTFSIGNAYLVYRIVDRANKHFARDMSFLSKTVEQLQIMIPKENVAMQIVASNMERDLSNIVEREHERSGILWGLLSMIPFLGWLVTIVVTQLVSGDFRRHRARESIVYGDIQNVSGKGIVQSNPSDMVAFRDNFTRLLIVTVSLILGGLVNTLVLFYLVSINSLGAIILLWIGILSLLSLYIAMTGPIDHFHRHRMFDPSITARLPPVQTVGV